jgi:hypothetical protein
MLKGENRKKLKNIASTNVDQISKDVESDSHATSTLTNNFTFF